MTFPKRNVPSKRSNQAIGNRSNIVFVTVCTKNRQKVLANDSAHSAIKTVWSNQSEWMVGCYVIMPDHIHLFCAPAKLEHCSVRDWISYWKSLVSKFWANETEKPVWQRAAWDRQLRSGESYAEKWHYVRQNPVRHQLVSDAKRWPYQGELNPLQWHDK